ncbi:MAG: hypothetical protein ACTS2F_05100 [Thainema sp.]
MAIRPYNGCLTKPTSFFHELPIFGVAIALNHPQPGIFWDVEGE